MSTPDAFVGIDLGTQSVRTVVVDADGVVRGSGRAPLSSHRTGVRHEQDPAQWWAAVCAATRRAVTEAGDVRLVSVAVCGTSGTVLLTDERGGHVGPALMYDDGRAEAQARRLNEAGAATWAARGYHRMQPTWAAPKALWLQEEGHRGRVLMQSDHVNARLVGTVVASDVSTSLKMGCDPLDLSWPADVFERAGLDPSGLSSLVLPGTRLGTVGAEAAAETGLPAGLPVVAGMTDSCAAQLAAGAVTPGSWNSVLGTTLALKGVAEAPVSDPAGVVYSHRSADGRWLPGGASGTGAGVVPQLLPGADLDRLGTLAARRPPSALVAYPLASSGGERFPFVAPQAEPFVLGAAADDVDLYAALLRGVALVERLCLDYLGSVGADVSGVLHTTGGGASSPYWCQLRADVSGRTVVVPEVTESAFGMAVLAAADHLGGLAPAAQRLVSTAATYEPRHDGRHDAAYDALVDALELRGWLPTATAQLARAGVGA